MNEKVKSFIEKAEEKKFNNYEEMIQFGKDNAKVFECIAPHLDKNLNLEFQLRNIKECPDKNMCGKCHKCDYMIQAFSYDGSFFSYGVYDLVCAY